MPKIDPRLTLGVLAALTVTGLLAADDPRAAFAAAAMTAILLRIIAAIVAQTARRQVSSARVVRR